MYRTYTEAGIIGQSERLSQGFRLRFTDVDVALHVMHDPERLDIQGTEFEIPHCGNCQDGVTWNIGIGSNVVGVVKLKFRSYTYWREFLAANEIHTRVGMWR